jgi:putative Holliday junction resolvase
MRYLAIDYGTKRTGLAICDAAETVASPLNVILGQKELLKKIAAVVQKEGVEAIVVGLPLNMDDSESAQTRLVRKFVERLRQYIGIPVYLQDERLTSFSAEEKLASAELKKAQMQKRSDAVAAAEILEAFLEQKHNTGEAGTDPAH